MNTHSDSVNQKAPAFQLSREWKTATLVGAAALAAAWLGIEWTREASIVAALWPANAVLFAAMLYRPSSEHLPSAFAFFLAVLLANLVHGDPLLVSVGLSVANLAEVFAAYGLSRWLLRSGAHLDSLKAFVQVLGCAAVAAPVVGAFLGAGIVHLALATPYWTVWTTWWAGAAVGMLVYFPICAVVAKGKLFGPFAGVSRTEMLLSMAVYSILTALVFLEGSTYSLLLLLPALLWVAIRLKMVGTAIAVAITGVVLTSLTVAGIGPIGEVFGVSVMAKVHDIHFVLLTLALPSLLIAITVQGRDRLIDALSASEERYRKLYDESPVMLHSIGTDGRMVSVSQFWLDKMGYRRDEVLGRKSTEFLTEESRRYATDVVLPQFFKEGAIKDIEYQFVAKNGEVFDVLMSAIQDKDPAHGTARSMAVIVDISDRKATEGQLADTVAQLKRSNRDLEQFAYLASHDLQEPLRMVSSFTELLSLEYNERLDAKGREYLHFAHDGAVRMSALIQDILAYSRIGRDMDMSGAVDLNHVVSAAVGKLSALIEETSAMVSHGALPTVRGNAAMLAVLFQNLINNALKYRSDQAPLVDIVATRQEGAWLLTVSDNGIGIDPRHHDRVFGLFKRLHTRSQYDGTGIGLAMCQRIVERHGGRIWVESELGEGSRFQITFPDSSGEVDPQ